MIMYTIIEKAPYSDCVRVALARLEKMHAVFAAAKSLGGGRAASGLVSRSTSLIDTPVTKGSSQYFKGCAHPRKPSSTVETNPQLV
jgi:hypothetical protein